MLTDLLFRLRSLLRRGTVEQELNEELREHLEHETQKYLDTGMSRSDAARRARLAMGGLEAVKEECRDARGTRPLEDFLADLRHAARILFRNPTFSLVALLSIGLAIGVNTAIFSLANAMLLKTLPLPEPNRLVFLNTVGEDGDLHAAPPYPCLERFRGASALSGMAAFDLDRMPVIIDGRAEKVLVQLASASYFDVLGVPAMLGRTFVTTDEHLDPPVAVLGYEFWQRRFGGTPDVLGRTITFKDRVLTVVGVTGPTFAGLLPGMAVDLTVPIIFAGAEALSARGRFGFEAVGRLANGAAQEQAEAELNPIFQAFMEETGASAGMRRTFSRMAVIPAGQGLGELREQVTQPLLLLAGIAGMVLLIACANVAILLVAQAAARRHEFATRVAIGASRERLVRQLLAESLLLGVIATCVGFLLARWLTATLLRFAPGPAPIALDLSLDHRVILFSAALCLATSLLFGLVPAVGTARVATYTDLKRRSTNALTKRLGLSPGTVLVIVQFTLSMVLLMTTALLVGTVASLRNVDAGFRPEGVTTFEVESLPVNASVEARVARWTMLVDRVAAVPGVQSATVSWLTPLSRRDRGVGIRVLGADPAVKRPGLVALNHVSAAYFETMRIPLRRGRTFTSRDDGSAGEVAIVSEAAARYYFGGADPVGQRIEIAKRVREIVGVVGDTKHQNLRDDIARFVYVPVLQPIDRLGSLFLAVRTRGEAAGVADAVRRELSSLGSDIVVGPATTMREQIDRTLVRERLMATLSLSFGVLGLTLGAIGLFGVMSSSVLRHRREIVVRMALGTTARSVRTRVLRESLFVAAIGIVFGVPLGVIGGRALSSLLFGVQPTSLPIIAGCIGILITVAAFAGYVPARRASRLNLASVLRAE